MTPAGPRVVVVGGGVIGCAIAWRLARRGARVVLLERDRPGEHASSAAAGMLSPLKEAEEPGPFLELGLRSLDRYPAFIEELESASGVDVGYRRDGRLDVALDDATAAALRRHRDYQTAAGFQSQLLEPPEVWRLEPELTTDAVLGLATEHDHQLDNRQLVHGLSLALDREGVDVRAGTRATAVLTEGERARGVRFEETGGGGPVEGRRVEADHVVVAAGAWSGQLDLGHALAPPLPIRPVRGQIVVLRTDAPVLRRTTWGPECYLVPRRDGRLLVGSTMEEAGFRTDVTVDAVEQLLASARRLVPTLSEAAVDGFQVGLRPAAEDGLPILGPDPQVRGLFHATGHFRNGILLAPETAERVTAMILDGRAAEPAFDPGRFS